MRRLSVQLVLVCLGASAVALAASPSTNSSTGGAPVALLSEVDLKTSTVLLSDLLPADAADSLRKASAAIALGSAPVAGSVRHMTRGEIENALLDQPQILAGITVPADVIVRRTYRQLSRKEVTAAINAALGRENTVDAAALSLQLSPLVTCEDPGLEVTGIEFDALHRVTRFRLWTAKEPENLPFSVTVPGRLMGAKTSKTPETTEARAAIHSGGQAAAPVRSEIVSPVVDNGAVKSPPKGSEMLVKAGVATQLVIEGADYRLTSTVIPLEPGALGQEIRVRDPLTHKLSSAQVAGPGLLKGSL
jgi:hypothetical protein